MGILLWIVFGALAGFIASLIMKNDSEQGTFKDVIMGIIGAMVGGFVMNLLGFSGVTGFNFYSLFVAVIGAVIIIFIGRKMRN